MNTIPPEYKIRNEVRDYLYPVTREHLKGKLVDFMNDVQDCRKVTSFEISELELNAYLYNLFAEVLLVKNEPFVKNPYLFVRPGELVLRADIPTANALRLFVNGVSKMNLDENVKKVMNEQRRDSEKNRAKSDKAAGTIALTFVMSVHWVKDHPYFYLERVYVGALPIPISIMLSDYQDQMNDVLWRFYKENLGMVPVYIRKIEAKNKVIRFKTEMKMTNEMVPACDLTNFKKGNPTLANALFSKDCLYGCTKEERQELDAYFNTLNGYGAADIEIAKVLRAKMFSGTMEGRDRFYREQRMKEIQKKQQLPERIIMPGGQY
ncbi:MAG: hypothetical protein WCX65_12705 [bacterium]